MKQEDLYNYIFKKQQWFQTLNPNWEYIYQEMTKKFGYEVGQITDFFHELKIYPERSMENLPEYFLCTSTQKEIKVPEGIKIIFGSAFRDAEQIEKIILPNTVTEIGLSVFVGCTNLKEINLPDSITFIGDHAFTECFKLKKLILPKNLITIEEKCFSNCLCLQEIHIPKKVIEINQGAFKYCRGLTRIYYSGTINEWHNIIKYDDTFTGTPKNMDIICIDGITSPTKGI